MSTTAVTRVIHSCHLIEIGGRCRCGEQKPAAARRECRRSAYGAVAAVGGIPYSSAEECAGSTTSLTTRSGLPIRV